MARTKPVIERRLTPAEVAALFGVDTQTVVRWSRAGKLPAVRTLGGHRRFSERTVRRLLAHADRVRGR